MLKPMKLLSIGLMLAMAIVTHAEEQRDYYGEPGLNAFKQTVGHTSIESIDPFSGIVQLQQTDLVVPGNGGLDISIHRSYTTPQDDMGKDWFNIMGSGWVMHYGRVVVPVTYQLSMCPSGFYGPSFDTVRDNPSFEKPDGGRELLISDTSDLSNRGIYKTKSNWKAECIQDRPGLKVTSPNGTVYWMDKEARISNPDAQTEEVSWFTSKVEDTSGNTLDISYVQFASTMQYIKEINANDGRKVVFNYIDVADVENLAPANELTQHAVVSSISSEGQVWTYSYTPILEGNYTDGSAYRLLALTTVTPPEGGAWGYGYQIHEGPVEEYTRKALLLDTVTYPYGGVVNYDYQAKDFYQEYGKNDLRKWVISQKHISGQNVTAGTWSYTFEPGSVVYSNFPGGADKTTITRPDGSREEMLHFGYKTINSGDVWRVGLLINKRIWDLENQSVHYESYNWGKRAISTENNTYSKLSGEWKLDNDVYATYMTGTWVSVDGVSNSGYTTTYADHDEFGNPRQIIANANKYYADEQEQVGGVHKTTNITYQNDLGRWIIGLPLTEEIVGVGAVTNTYTPEGKLETENNYGIQTGYLYHANGDLHQVIDANGNTTTYTDYKRGQAQTIEYPESISASRVISNRGTLTSETNGRSFTKTYQWDDLNRLTDIQFAKGSPVDITWGASTSVLIRGNYREEKFYDGFGQVYQIKRKHLLTGEEIITRTGYDAEGRVEFKGMPYKSGETEKGITYQFDAMGRVKRETYEDGTYTTMEYPNIYTEIVTDALGRKTKQTYRFYGSPSNDRTLLQMEQVKAVPEDGDIIVQLRKNKLNQTTQIFQAHYQAQAEVPGYSGYPRTFTFNAKTQLEVETHPEYNPIHYTYDAAGNLETKTYEGLPGITYGYDGLNRLRTITFADGQPGYYMVYNGNNNLESVSNDNTSRGFIYDGNDNLEHEQVSIHGKNYQISYGYNTSDFIETVTYPSGRVVTFAPDAFGRATSVSPYATNVTSESNGNTRDVEFANGAVNHFTYTDRGWLDNLIVDELVHLDYGYDAVGNIKTIGDLITPINNRSMNYDDKNRLNDATGSWGTATYSYDGIGNIRGKAIGSNVVDSYQYLDGKNRLDQIDRLSAYYNQTKYAYNGKGELLSKTNIRTASPISFNDVYEYTYDNQGNLQVAKKTQYSGVDPVSTENYTFTYDAQNNRVQRIAKGKTKQFLFSNNGLLLGEYYVAEELGVELIGKEHIYLQGKKVASVTMNKAPNVFAGEDSVINEGAVASLRATATDFDGSIKSYAWRQSGGTPIVTLSSANGANPTFVAPQVESDTILTFEISVTDNLDDVSKDTVSVTIKNLQAPVAVIQASKPKFYSAIDGGPGEISLSGSQSYDPQAYSLTYQWQPVSGSAYTLSSTAFPQVVFNAPIGQHAIRLTATSMVGLSGTTEFNFEVLNYMTNADALPDSIPDGWEAYYFGDANLYADDADPDNDLLGNALEYTLGTNPLEADIAFSDKVRGVKGFGADGYTQIEWSALAGASSYNLYWTTEPTFNKATANKIENVTSPYIHKNLDNGRYYKYMVVGANAIGESSDSATVYVVPNYKSADGKSYIHQPSFSKDFKGNYLSLVNSLNAGHYELTALYFDSSTNVTTSKILRSSTTNAINELGPVLKCGDKYLVSWIETRFISSGGYSYSVPAVNVAYMDLFQPTATQWSSIYVLDSGINDASILWDHGSKGIKAACNKDGKVVMAWLREIDYANHTVNPETDRLMISDGFSSVSPLSSVSFDGITDFSLDAVNVDVSIGGGQNPVKIVTWKTMKNANNGSISANGVHYNKWDAANGWSGPQGIAIGSGGFDAPVSSVSTTGKTFLGFKNGSNFKVYYSQGVGSLLAEAYSLNGIISADGEFDQLERLAFYTVKQKVTGSGKTQTTSYVAESHYLTGATVNNTKLIVEKSSSMTIGHFQLNEIGDVRITLAGHDGLMLTSAASPVSINEPMPDPEITTPQESYRVFSPEVITLAGSYPIEGAVITIKSGYRTYGTVTVQNGEWQFIYAPEYLNVNYNFTIQASDGLRFSNSISVPAIREGVITPVVTDPVTAISVGDSFYRISGTYPDNDVTIRVLKSTPVSKEYTTSVNNGVWSVQVELSPDAVNKFSIQSNYSNGAIVRSSPSALVTIAQGNAILPPTVITPAYVETINELSTAISGSYPIDGTFINLYADSDNNGLADSATPVDTAVVSMGQWTITPQFVLSQNYNNYSQTFRYVVKAVNGSQSSPEAKVPAITVQVKAPVPSATIVKSTSQGYTVYTVTLAADKPSTFTWSLHQNTGGIIVSGGANTPGVQQDYIGPITIKTKTTVGTMYIYATDGNGWTGYREYEVQ